MNRNTRRNLREHPDCVGDPLAKGTLHHEPSPSHPANPSESGLAEQRIHPDRTPGGHRIMRKLGEVRLPTTTFVLADEHPDSINGAGLAVQPTDDPAAARIIDFPASYHNGAAGFSFVDGHAEVHKWVDARTQPPILYTGALTLNVPSPGNGDATWMSDRTTHKN